MNRTQLTVFVISLALFFGGFALYSVHQQHRSFVQAQSYVAANDLINSNRAELFVSTKAGFKERWDRFAKNPVQIEVVRMGDESAPIGDGQASSRVIFVNDANEHLAIRIRWDGHQERFDLLGFWTPK